jgi:hypothetical protein
MASNPSELQGVDDCRVNKPRELGTVHHARLHGVRGLSTIDGTAFELRDDARGERTKLCRRIPMGGPEEREREREGERAK